MTVKTVKSLWVDEELKHCMVERDEAKGMANKSGSPTDWQTYCKNSNLHSDSYVEDVNNIFWTVVYNGTQPDTAIIAFKKLLIPVTNKHSHIKKITVKT